MKLDYLYNMGLIAYKGQFLKQQDPNRPELTGQPLSSRSGNQDTPLKPEHRKFFNAPSPGTAGKIGYPDQSWSNIKSFTPSGAIVRPYNLYSHH